MDLQYKGMNHRGRKEWVERDLTSPTQPDGLAMEEWQVNQYVPFVEGILACIGRNLTKEELNTVAWLAGSAQSTIDNIMSLIKSANILKGANRMENQEYKSREFKVGDDCPFCNGKLIDINNGGLLDNKIVLKCSNDQCYFNQVDFR